MQWINVGPVTIRPRKVGSEWWADLTCPAPHCGRKVSVKNDQQFGEYGGWCGGGHELAIPHNG